MQGGHVHLVANRAVAPITCALGSELDHEGRGNAVGNSSYFPGPRGAMLPNRLSGDLFRFA